MPEKNFSCHTVSLLLIDPFVRLLWCMPGSNSGYHSYSYPQGGKVHVYSFIKNEVMMVVLVFLKGLGD